MVFNMSMKSGPRRVLFTMPSRSIAPGSRCGVLRILSTFLKAVKLLPAAGFPVEGRFVFRFAFDYPSGAKRKKPEVVCRAFAEAFPEVSTAGPLCVIQSINASQHPGDHALLRHRWAHRPDIVFRDEFLSMADRDLLIWRPDACVSLHRPQALGLTLLEGMAPGKPCIAMAYSGNLDFMTEALSRLIPCSGVPEGVGSLHDPAHQTWAESDNPAAAAAMRELSTRSPAVQAHAAAGQDFVREHHNPFACGHRMAALLAEAAKGTPRANPIPEIARAAAYATLTGPREKILLPVRAARPC